MSERTVKHEVKLHKSVVVILAVMAFGLCANAFALVFSIRNATAKIPTPPSSSELLNSFKEEKVDLMPAIVMSLDSLAKSIGRDLPN